MKKVILVHADCNNLMAKGDYSFAGNIAKDLVRELQHHQLHDFEVILVSSVERMFQFTRLYGSPVNNYITIDGTRVGLSSLDELDVVKHRVIAFIDAAHCRYPEAERVKRVLSPESKLLFVGNLNEIEFSSVDIQEKARLIIQEQQPGLYEYFEEDLFLGSAGFGHYRLGLPTIPKIENTTQLAIQEQNVLPKGHYGFIYLAEGDATKNCLLMPQYIKLSKQPQYLLVGDFECPQDYINNACVSGLPQIVYHQSLPNSIMRKALTCASGLLIVSTGVTSTLEAMQEGKISYYQYYEKLPNEHFVANYLEAVKSIILNNIIPSGGLVAELSQLLFAEKPLDDLSLQRTEELLKVPDVSTSLVQINKEIIKKANGTLATKLLGFLGTPRTTKTQIQLATACAFLRKDTELTNPTYEEALRRAAAYGYVFELKIILKSIPKSVADKAESERGYTALHFAAINQNFDCAQVLVNAAMSLDIQDKEGQTPLHKAIINGDMQMIQLLVTAGASLTIPDIQGIKPLDYAGDDFIAAFINNCFVHI